MSNIIIDDLGYGWKFDGERVYMILAEEEMLDAGEDTSQNGYYCDSLEEAIDILKAGGYLSDVYVGDNDHGHDDRIL